MAAPQRDDIFSSGGHGRGRWSEKLGYFGAYSLTSFLAAFVIGLAQMYILVRLWGYISVYTPLATWFLALGLGGTGLRAAVFFSDALCNVVFCLPAAYVLCKLKPPVLFVYLILAIAPGFIWQYRLLLLDPPALKNWLIFIPGVLLTLLPLPLATLAMRLALARHAPNNRCRES
jgi:hypothetical protein